MDLHEKVCNGHANGWVSHGAEISVDALPSHAHLLQGCTVVFQKVEPNFCLLDPLGHMNINVAKEKLECIHIFYESLALKVHRVRLDTVKERRGQFGRWLNLGCPEVRGHDGGRSTILWANISKSGFGPSIWMVIDDDIKIDTLKTYNHLLNQKVSPKFLEDDLKPLFISYLRTWKDKKIPHVQFNVVDKETLIDAQEHPQKHQDLIVRVAGFSAYFTDLSKGLQDHIIARTQQNLL